MITFITTVETQPAVTVDSIEFTIMDIIPLVSVVNDAIQQHRNISISPTVIPLIVLVEPIHKEDWSAVSITFRLPYRPQVYIVSFLKLVNNVMKVLSTDHIVIKRELLSDYQSQVICICPRI